MSSNRPPTPRQNRAINQVVARMREDAAHAVAPTVTVGRDATIAPPVFTTYRHFTGNSAYGPTWWGVRAYGARDAVDYYRTETGALYAARLLNTGCAVIDHHATISSRVIAID